MERAKPHSTPQARNVQQTVKGSDKLAVSVIEELAKVAATVVGETRLPPLLKVDITVPVVLSDFAIDFSVRWFFLVRVFFHQGGYPVRVRV